MTFLEARISTGVRRGSRGGPTGKRAIERDALGRIVGQTFLRQHAVHKYTFDFGAKLEDDAEEIASFFYVVMFGGPYIGFRVRDWNDFELDADRSAILDDGGVWRVHRVRRVGVVQYARPLRKLAPEAGFTAWRTRAGSVSAVVGATVDYNTAIATLPGHQPGDTYTCDAQFDVPVTFADDDALAHIEIDGTPNELIQSIGQVELEEVWLP